MLKFNRFRSVIAAVLMSSILLLSLSGCMNQKAGGASVEVTDQLQRTVKVPSKVNRIISSYTIATSLLIALGLEDKLVGIEISAEDKPIYKAAAPEIIKLPAVGSGKTLNIEECVKLKPDLVIVPYRLKDFAVKLEKLGIPVIAVAPEDLESFKETVKLVGKATGAEKRAEELLKFYDEKIRMVEKATENIKDKPVVYLAGSKSPLTTCTREMYQNYLIELAGGKNASQEIEKGYWANVSMEQVLKWNPDIIFSVQYSAFKDEEIIKGEKWKSVKAVQENKVYRFPSKLEPWDYPAPSSILGVLWLTNKLHPEVYSNEMFLKDSRDFFKKFYDLDVSNEEIGV